MDLRKLRLIRNFLQFYLRGGWGRLIFVEKDHKAKAPALTLRIKNSGSQGCVIFLE